jgi:predicted Zn-dependent peptidase
MIKTWFYHSIEFFDFLQITTDNDRSINQMQAGLLMGLESTSHRCERLAKQMHLFGRVIPMVEVLEKLARVNVKSVQAACQNVLLGKPTLTTLGLVEHVMTYDDLVADLAA